MTADQSFAFQSAVEAHERGDLVAAEENYRQAAALGSVEAAFQLGVILDDLGRYDEAADAYRKAVAAGDSEARLNLANLLVDALDRRDEAEALYRESIASGDARAMFDFGTVLAREEEPVEARRFFEKALAHGDPRGHRGLAWLHLANGDLNAASAAYRRAADGGDEGTAALEEALRKEGVSI